MSKKNDNLIFRAESKTDLITPFFMDSVSAGFPSPATDYVQDDSDLNAHLIKNIPSTFLIRVQGKSMNKVGIHDGDLLVVDKSLDPKNFSTVIVFLANSQCSQISL